VLYTNFGAMIAPLFTTDRKEERFQVRFKDMP